MTLTGDYDRVAAKEKAPYSGAVGAS